MESMGLGYMEAADSERSRLSALMIDTPEDLVRYVMQASFLEGGPFMWMNLHVNQTSGEDTCGLTPTDAAYGFL